MLELIELGDKAAIASYVEIRGAVILVVWLFSIVACLIDFWSGVTTAKAIGEPLASHGFRRTVTKVGDYARILMFTLMFDAVGCLFAFYKLPFASMLCGVAVLIIEGKSVIENSRRKKANAGEIPEIIKEIVNAATSTQGKDVFSKIEKYILEAGKNTEPAGQAAGSKQQKAAKKE